MRAVSTSSINRVPTQGLGHRCTQSVCSRTLATAQLPRCKAGYNTVSCQATSRIPGSEAMFGPANSVQPTSRPRVAFGTAYSNVSGTQHCHKMHQRQPSSCQCNAEPHGSSQKNGCHPDSIEVEQHGKVERLRLAEGIPMVAWYTKSPAGTWKSQIRESPSIMKLVSLLSIVLLVNMTSFVFSLFVALIGADVVNMVKQSDSSGAVMLLVNFVFFGLGPSALAKVYKSIVKALLAPVKNKYKGKIKRSSKLGPRDVEKGVGEIIHVLFFEKAEAGTEGDIEVDDDADIDTDAYST